MTPDLYTDIPDKVYRQWDAISRSDLAALAQGYPLSTVKYKMEHPPTETPQMLKGTALHMLVLEPERFNKEVIPAPNRDRRSNVDKEWWKTFELENEGKMILKQELFNEVITLGTKLLAIPVLSKTLKQEDTAREVSALFMYRGVLCKCRMDLLVSCNDRLEIWDIKTSSDIRAKAFSYSVSDYAYDMQAFFYTQALKELGHECNTFRFFCVETVPPYNTIVYTMSDTAIDCGRHKVNYSLDLVRNALTTGNWPGFSNQIITVPDREIERAQELGEEQWPLD